MLYLSADQCFALDRILKGFEVAFRSYVATRMVGKFRTSSQFHAGLTALRGAFGATTVVNSGKLNAKLGAIIGEYQEIYSALDYCSKCTIIQDYEASNVIYLSKVIDLAFLFHDPDFRELSSGFSSVEQLVYLSVCYQKLRNALSHPASSKVVYDEAKDVLAYVNKLTHTLDDSFFWYVSKPDITSRVSAFLSGQDGSLVRVHNLNEMSFQHKRVLFRDQQLRFLKDTIVGASDDYRRCGSLVIYGYGGVGKTAVVVEFLHALLKDIADKNAPSYEFILFFSSKEEQLRYSAATGELYISEIRKQVASFDDLKRNLFSYLSVPDWSHPSYRRDGRGIVVIDNFENFPEDDKPKVLEFIKRSPRNVSFILTSREEERCEEQLYLDVFSQENNGLGFLDQYIDENSLSISLTVQQKLRLIEGARGNTLILVLALERLSTGRTTIISILSELDNVSSQNIQTIADFMYKNTFDQTIKELTDKGRQPIEMMKVISLYNEPVDLYSVSELSKLPIAQVESMCNFLASKLVLVKSKELFSLSEFANKFVFIKFLPNRVELAELVDRIRAHKHTIKANLSRLEQIKSREPLLDRIIEDWKPLNYVDEIAISEAFNLYKFTKDRIQSKDTTAIKLLLSEVDRRFRALEQKTSHPYIRYQKSRVYQMIFDAGIDRDAALATINDYFERTVLSVQFDYSYISRTRSYASVLWIYGIFLSNIPDLPNAVKYLEESKRIFEDIACLDENYFKALFKLARCYVRLYETTKIKPYLNQALSIYRDTKGKQVASRPIEHLRMGLARDIEDVIADEYNRESSRPQLPV